MADRESFVVYGGRYARVEDALGDLVDIQTLHDEGRLGRYDAAVVTKEPSGKIVVANTDATERGGGAGMGAVAGGLIGAVFPPAFLASAAVGAAVGAAGGNAAKRLRSKDAKQLADELLEPGQTGVLLVTEQLEEAYATKLFSRSLRARAITIEASEDLKQAVRAEARLGG